MSNRVVFARTLGGVIEQGEKGIFKVTLDTKENVMADYLRGTVLWHIDGFGDDVPTLASMLSARRISPVGGQTEFANTYAAFDDLPEERQQALQKLRVVHTMEATQRDVFPNPTPQQKAAWARYPDKDPPARLDAPLGAKVAGAGLERIAPRRHGQGRGPRAAR